MNICRSNCIPNIIPNYKEIVVDGAKVVILTIPKGVNKPYYTVDNIYYIRVGTTKRIALREELMRLFQASEAVHFDISSVGGTTKKDLNMDLIRDYFLKYNMFDLYEETDESVDRILVNADILREGVNTKECTVGGLLIYLRCSKRKKEIYPAVVLREDLVNAVVHRNYSIIGSKIRVLMFSDRIEFHSPGKLHNIVTIDKMKIGVSYSRNPFLVKYMENLRYIDQLGRGVPMIIKNMKNLGAREPELKEIGEEFVLTIYRPD